MEKSKLLRMDNMGIVVESLDNAISFFSELGLHLEGRAQIKGEWSGRITGLGAQHVEIAMMVTPDGHSRLELSRFIDPAIIADHRNGQCLPLKISMMCCGDSLTIMELCWSGRWYNMKMRIVSVI